MFGRLVDYPNINNSYMEVSGSATIKYRSIAQTPRARGNPPNRNHKVTIAESNRGNEPAET